MSPHHFRNILLLIYTFPFNISQHHFSHSYLRLIFLEIFVNNKNFLSLQDLRKLSEESELKCYAACLECEGLQELELAMVGMLQAG